MGALRPRFGFDRDQCPRTALRPYGPGRHALRWRSLMKRIAVGCGLALMASAAFGADAESGKRLAQLRCAACHIVTPSPRNDLVADAPPFLTIARKFGSDTEAL